MLVYSIKCHFKQLRRQRQKKVEYNRADKTFKKI